MREYLGTLHRYDPLYRYFQNDIQPLFQGASYETQYHVYRLNGSKDVYLYEDDTSGDRVICKFYSVQARDPSSMASLWVRQEFENLCLLRSLGMSGYPHHVARPLGYNPSINNVLVEEYCEGESLTDIIEHTLATDKADRLLSKLTALAYFMARLHNHTATDHGDDPFSACMYFEELVGRLLEQQLISIDEARDILRLRDRWGGSPCLREDRQVLIHGDATPGNFLFGGGLSVTAIDLERMRYADRAYDIGRIAGELKHFFLRGTGDKYSAEHFITHFLTAYCSHFPEREQAFQSISTRLPFFMGLTLLRIARNDWLSADYRRELIEEAALTLG